MTEIWSVVITGVCTVMCAIIGAVSLNAHNKSERREKIRREEALLSLQMTDATLQLSWVCSNALTNGVNNGNVEIAREAAERASAAYKTFMQEQVSYAISK